MRPRRLEPERLRQRGGCLGVGRFLCQYPAGAARTVQGVERVSVAFGRLLLLAASLAFAFAGRAPWLFWAVGLVWGGAWRRSAVKDGHGPCGARVCGRATAGAQRDDHRLYVGWHGSAPLASAALAVGRVTGLAAVLGALALATLLAARRSAALNWPKEPAAQALNVAFLNASGLLFPPRPVRALPAPSAAWPLWHRPRHRPSSGISRCTSGSRGSLRSCPLPICFPPFSGGIRLEIA